MASARRCSVGAASMRVVPTREYRRPRPVAYLSRSSRAASARTLAMRLVSEAWASSSIMGASASGTSSAERPVTGHEARVGDADGGSREVVVAVVVVARECPASLVF